MIRSRYLLLSDGLYRDRAGRVARLAYSARQATLFALDAPTAGALDSGDLASITDNQLKRLAELSAVVEPDEDELGAVLSRLREGSDDPGVRVFTIMPTSWCNMACSYCGQEHHKSTARMERVAQRVEAALADPLTRRVNVNWFGGEPLLALGIIRSLSARFLAVGKPYSASMATNGSLLSTRTLHLLAQECGLTSIEVTIDGPQPVHDRRRLKRNGTGSFHHIVEALRTPPPGLEISIRVNIDADNEDSIDELIVELARLGFAAPPFQLYLASVHSWGNDVSKVELEARRFAEREAGWLRLAGSLGIRFGAIPAVLKRTTCVATSRYGEVIDSAERVYSCSEHPLVPVVRETGVVATLSDLDPAAPRPLGMFDDWYDEVGDGSAQCGRCPLLPVCGGSCPKLWREGHMPCPSMKFNFADRLDIAARQLGFTPV